jgi:hypothetical protein
MSSGLLKAIIVLLMVYWLVIEVPIWLLAMGFAGEFFLLPALPPETAEFWVHLSSMYLPPVLAGVLSYVLVKRNQRTKDA